MLIALAPWVCNDTACTVATNQLKTKTFSNRQS
jgi:hypothetical protein